ncbi:MAG: ADP-ribosylglycohydrolase family protein [Planctomycetota bacterium]
MPTVDQFVGCLLGTAVADAFALPYEGVPKRRALRLQGEPNRHRFLFGRGMVSDDTEHSCMVAHALVLHPRDPRRFELQLARSMKRWLLGCPAGIGRATLRACLKLWLGVPPEKSGVQSAGNGPAMRAAIVGVASQDLEQLIELNRVSSRITHKDPKAEYGALAISLAAHLAASEAAVSPRDYLEKFVSLPNAGDEAWQELVVLLQAVVDSAEAGDATLDFAIQLGLEKGVSGYVYHSVPVALHAWMTHRDDFASAVQNVIRCGGDTDTVAAMAGGIIGAQFGSECIPRDWLARMAEPCYGETYLSHLGQALYESWAGETETVPPSFRWYYLLPRNSLFLVTVLVHGFRRLLPPY